MKEFNGAEYGIPTQLESADHIIPTQPDGDRWGVKDWSLTDLPEQMTVQVFPSDMPDADSVGCWGPPSEVAAWMHGYANRLAAAAAKTRVRMLGVHPIHEPGEADR